VHHLVALGDDEAVWQRRIVAAGEHRNLVPEPGQSGSQLGDVHILTTRIDPAQSRKWTRMLGHERDPHPVPLPPRTRSRARNDCGRRTPCGRRQSKCRMVSPQAPRVSNASVRILLWDVHGGYTDALTRGPHDYLFLRDASVADLPGLVDKGELCTKGLIRLGQNRPSNLHEVSVEELRDAPPDLVLAQRLEEVDACAALLSRTPGRDLGAVFLEHNTPKGDVPVSRHPLADQRQWPIVHVTHFNRLFWDCGSAETAVIEHGLPDPGYRYSGTQERLAFVVNEPVRRWRTTGTDLLPEFGDAPIDAFGIDGHLLASLLRPRCPQLTFAGNLSPAELDDAMIERRAYLHLNRWTSLGLSLIQAMLLGLPVVVLDTTDASRAVPETAGVRSSDPAELVTVARRLLADHDLAIECGRAARAHALDRYDINRFLDAWTERFEQAAR
jgi:hypothetical protein